jgi:hypothetical protein
VSIEFPLPDRDFRGVAPQADLLGVLSEDGGVFPFGGGGGVDLFGEGFKGEELPAGAVVFRAEERWDVLGHLE